MYTVNLQNSAHSLPWPKLSFLHTYIKAAVLSALRFAPENYFFQGSRAGNGASSTAGRFVSNSPEQTVEY